jgi:hypothetical protein
VTKEVTAPKTAQKTVRLTQRTLFAIEAGAQLDEKSAGDADFIAAAVVPFSERLFRKKTGRAFDSFFHVNPGVRWCRVYAMRGLPLDDTHEMRRAFVLKHRAFFFERGEGGKVTVNVANVEALVPEKIEELDAWRALSAKNYWDAGRAMAARLRDRGLTPPTWPPKKEKP